MRQRLFTPSITKKVSLLLALLACTGIAALGSVYWMLRGSAHDTAFVDVAGRQRLLSEELLAVAHMLRLGQEDDRPLFRSTIGEFDRALGVLESGGEAAGHSLPAAPEQVQDEVAAARKRWDGLEPALRLLARLPAADPRFPAAYAEIKEGIPALREASDAVVQTYEHRAASVRGRTLAILLALLGLDAGLLVLGLFLTRRYLARPVGLLMEGVRRLRAGDLGHRVPAVTQDELAELARTFNDMSHNLAGLLASERAARADAEAAHLVLVEQNDKLRELDRLKDEFVALVSHELRTPLTSIKGYVHLLRNGEGSSVTSEQDSSLDVIARNADRLLHLVNDLLFVARLDAGVVELDPAEIDLATIAAESVERARPEAAARSVELRLAAERAELVADPLRLAQLLDNLVSNALKFTPPGGRVEVRVAASPGRAVLEVADTGMGIPEAERACLFERFYRTSPARKQAIQGTGLGLTIVKAIAEAHGGRVSVESAEGAGTTFRVELPVEERDSSWNGDAGGAYGATPSACAQP